MAEQFSTFKKDLENIGIHITDEQYSDLCEINLFMKGIGEIESIKFKGQEMPVEFVQKEEKGSKMVRTSKKPISLSCLIKKKPICQMDIFR